MSARNITARALGVLCAAALFIPGTAAALETGDLAQGVPVPSGSLMLDTSDGITPDMIHDAHGFDYTQTLPGYDDHGYFWTPLEKGAGLTLQDAGEWTDPSGRTHQIDMTVTVLDWHGPVCLSTRHIAAEGRDELSIGAGNWNRPESDRSWIELGIDLKAADGADMTGFAGVTGFADLDGGTDGYNEGVELINGFDTAYTMTDAHLTRYGTNGWAGNTDENALTTDKHALEHYLGASFTSTSLTIRYGVAAGQSRSTTFMPSNIVNTWPLEYDLNDGQGAIPNEKEQ